MIVAEQDIALGGEQRTRMGDEQGGRVDGPG